MNSLASLRAMPSASTSRPSAPSRSATMVILCSFKLSAMGGSQQRTQVVSVSQTPHVPPPSGPPMPVLAAGGLLLLGVARALIDKRRAGSLYGLEERGYLDQNRYRKDIFMNDVMKNVNTVPMPTLSDEQIAAARARRQKERANHKITLEDIELPENHPWATKAPASKDDEERVRARLRVRRGAPPPPATPSGGEDVGELRARPRTGRDIESAQNARGNKL